MVLCACCSDIVPRLSRKKSKKAGEDEQKARNEVRGDNSSGALFFFLGSLLDGPNNVLPVARLSGY